VPQQRSLYRRRNAAANARPDADLSQNGNMISLDTNRQKKV